ncbi:hypothetical protein G9A89_010959 [Geosiphon pyriformis]|nr:hypothetical protein G9A89_010959 [Geosiphon pyriformis]
MGICHKLFFSYHSQTNGLVEHFNKTLCKTLAKTTLFAYRTVNYDITSYEHFYLLYGQMTTLSIETDIETIPFKEITIGNYKDILQRKLGTILDSLVEARIIAFEKIKQFQEKLKKKKTYKTLFLSIGDLVLKYHSNKDNVYDQNIQNAFYTLHEYWIKNYPNATLTIEKQTTITDNSGTHTVIRPKKTTTRREKIGSKIDKYLLESITAILASFITIGKTIKEILPIDKKLVI